MDESQSGKRPYTPEDDATIMRMRAAGESYAAIGLAIGRCEATALNRHQILERRALYGRDYGRDSKLCGECKSWVPGTTRDETMRRLGTCTVTGCQKARCDWCDQK